MWPGGEVGEGGLGATSSGPSGVGESKLEVSPIGKRSSLAEVKGGGGLSEGDVMGVGVVKHLSRVRKIVVGGQSGDNDIIVGAESGEEKGAELVVREELSSRGKKGDQAPSLSVVLGDGFWALLREASCRLAGFGFSSFSSGGDGRDPLTREKRLWALRNKAALLSAKKQISGGYQKPAWLNALYTQKFFVACSAHEMAKKNEKNVLCLDCCISMCPHCLPWHRGHRLIQIRRYVYHEVIRLEDLENLIDCSSVQPYTINSAKVIFIKKRPQNRQFKGAGNNCTSCDRCLQEPYFHCSLGCKVDYVLKRYRDLTPYLRVCTTLQLGPDFLYPQDMGDEDMMTHSTILDCDDPMSSISGSSGSENDNSMMACTTEIVRKKRSGLFVCGRLSSNHDHYNNKVVSSVTDEDMATSISRRKGVPRRSPLC
ncbi:hypothetical protein V2J09_010372 [Rumex salicifolius]